MSDYSMTIDGEPVVSDQTFAVLNPATEEVIANAPSGSRQDLDAAVAAAERAFGPWSQTSLEERSQKLLEISAALKEQMVDFGALLTQEQGKVAAKGMEEAIGAMVWFQVTAGYPIPVEVLVEGDDSRIELRRRPIGVVGAITPWNYPLLMAVWKIAPAILAGNTVVLKPSPHTPLTSLKLGELLREILPPGVVNVVSGMDELGEWMTQHSGIRKIAFTGSVVTGKKIMQSVAPDLKRITLELGGNDAAIVMEDVDPEAVAEKIIAAAFGNTGQICAAIKRLYVHEAIYDSICEALIEQVKRIKVGPGTESDSELGPLNNEMQFDRISELVEDAKRNGGRVLTGGKPMPCKGFFYPLTLVADVAEGVRLVDEEQFGPALPIIRFSDVDDAIRRANDSHYGLGGSIWTSDVTRGVELATRLESGTAWVNQHTHLIPTAPFGGVKWSGIGRENGVHGLDGYLELQVVDVTSLDSQ